MIANVEWVLAWRYLRARRQEGFISVVAIFSLVGITLGVGTLIVVLAVMNGFRDELFRRILGVTGHVQLVKTPEGIPQFRDLSERIMLVPGVTRATPLIEAQVLLSSDSGARGVLVRGIAARDFLARPVLSRSAGALDMDKFQGEAGLLVGDRLARILGVSQGDRLRMISPEGQNSPFGLLPRVEDLSGFWPIQHWSIRIR